MSLIDTLTRLDGRISRKPYWIGSLLILGAAIAVAVAAVAAGGEAVFEGRYSGNNLFALAFGWVILLASVPVALKRLHDLNRSGLYLLPLVVLDALLTAGDLIGKTGTETAPNTLGWVLVAARTLYALVLFIQLGFFHGTAGPNYFGPDPLEVAPSPALP